MVGVLLGLRSEAEADLAYVHLHVVDPAIRGRGVGRALYEEFGRAMHARGCRRIRALAAPGRDASRRFHEALGFVGILSAAHVGPGQDRIVFERPLPFGEG
jgi:L-amino acid N-acyltransferase YncA